MNTPALETAPIKPSKINVIGTGILIGGAWSILGSILIVVLTGFACAPLAVFCFVCGVYNLLKGLQMARNGTKERKLAKRCIYLLLAQILILDVIGAALGAFLLVLLDDPEVRAYYDALENRPNATQTTANATPQATQPHAASPPQPATVAHASAPANPQSSEPSQVQWSTEPPAPKQSPVSVQSVPVASTPRETRQEDSSTGYKVAAWGDASQATREEDAPAWATVPAHQGQRRG